MPIALAHELNVICLFMVSLKTLLVAQTILPNNRMVNEQLIGKYVEGSGLGRDLNQRPPEYKAGLPVTL
jgi:hypothetical protein